jgi:hypothetical protein
LLNFVKDVAVHTFVKVFEYLLNFVKDVAVHTFVKVLNGGGK